MSPYFTPRYFVQIATVALIFLVAALAVIQSRPSEDRGTIAPLELEQVDALVSELARCRTVTLNETASLENCRRVWTESRRQFFGPTRTTPSPPEPISTPTRASGKYQDRVSPAASEHQQNGVR